MLRNGCGSSCGARRNGRKPPGNVRRRRITRPSLRTEVKGNAAPVMGNPGVLSPTAESSRAANLTAESSRAANLTAESSRTANLMDADLTAKSSRAVNLTAESSRAANLMDAGPTAGSPRAAEGSKAENPGGLDPKAEGDKVFRGSVFPCPANWLGACYITEILRSQVRLKACGNGVGFQTGLRGETERGVLIGY